MNAQPQTDPVRTVENITPITNELGRKWSKVIATDGHAAARYHDTIRLTLLGQQVTPSYLVDRKGVVWSLGTMDFPFVIHTFPVECGHCEERLEAINTVASEYADRVVTFVLMPTPEAAHALAQVEEFNDDVVVLYDDHFRDPYTYPTDSRLLGLIGYPVTHYLDGDRKIAGLSHGGRYLYLHPKRGTKETERKWEGNLVKALRKGMERLLKWEETRNDQK